ncbi:MAG TPA: PIN domain-containing protein [Thermoanaerobaculia bacterium]
METLVVITTEHNVAEIEEYVPYFAERYGLAPGLLLDVLTALPIEVYREHDYAAQLPLANQLLGYRDADDVALAALALNFQIPVWSNDRDFERFPTGVFTTATLLRFFGL